MNRVEAIEFAHAQQDIFGGKMGEFLKFVEDELTHSTHSNALDAEPRAGRWIKDGETYALYKCSVCKEFCSGAGWANCIKEEQMYRTFKHCPNCGARMEGDRDA